MHKLFVLAGKYEGICCSAVYQIYRFSYQSWQVDDMTADFVITQLLFLDAEDSKKDIKLFINSPGGSVTAGTSIC